ncbi:unnamed protein product [Arabidopsis lyrata]|nr:unnamed protein product [Arabidopsis lyrata]
MGIEGVPAHLKSGNMDIISTPPGFCISNIVCAEECTPRQRKIQVGVDTRADNWIRPSSEALRPRKTEVRRRRPLKVSETEVLEEVPVFNPTEEEFSDTLSYISSLRDRAEPYGICCVVPPPSWKPPCLFKEKKIWEASTFFPQVQLFGIQTENPKIKKEVDADSDDAASEGVQFGPGYTLETFKNFADTYKKSHFIMKDEVLGSENSSPRLKPDELTVADIEKEYRQLVESPLIEIGTQKLLEVDFPYLHHLNLASTHQFWESEKERLYSLCYLYVGAPRVWYSVAGCHRSKFKAAMKSFIPEMSEEQPKKSHDPVMIMSPYQLSMEGSYYSAFDTGFNCLEKADFAPRDWLPHGDIAVQLNQEKSKKSLTSYDKLLLSAAREAVKCLKEYALSKKNTACYMRWNDSGGTDGLFSNIVKEKNRREFLSNSLESQRMDKSYDAVTKRECYVCLGDLYLSAVNCSCSADRYSCLGHMRKLCACPCDRKSFLYMYNIDELNLLVEAQLYVQMGRHRSKILCFSSHHKFTTRRQQRQGNRYRSWN